jgi:hypothetical protein
VGFFDRQPRAGEHDGTRLANRTYPSPQSVRRTVSDWWARGADALRAAGTLRRDGGRLPPSATLNAQFWLQAVPWRPTAGWAVVASLLAAGALDRVAGFDWPRLVLVWLLADLLWGSLWRMAGGREQILPLGKEVGEARLRLPYLQPGSPAAELLDLDTANSMPYVVRIAAPTLALALLAAAALGRAALVGTALLAAITVFGWIVRRSLHVSAPSLHALAVVALPWWLALAEFGPGAGGAGFATALLVLWTVHHWGEARGTVYAGDRVAPLLIGAAELGLAALLIYAKAPIWLAILAVLALPTWIAVYQRQPLGGQRAWWLAAMLISAAAVGQLG